MILRSTFGAGLVIAVTSISILPSGCASGGTDRATTGGASPSATGGSTSVFQGGSVAVVQGGASASSGGASVSGGMGTLATGGTTSVSTGGSGAMPTGGNNGGTTSATGGTNSGGTNSGGTNSGGTNSGGVVAVAGNGSCAARLTLCGSACVDLQGSATNCGACGTVCPMGQTCSAGMCRCAIGSMVCNGACQDTASSVNSCGSCTNVCAKGASCVAGVCQCPSPQAACGGTCLDVTKDPANCGTCGTKCTGTQQCLYGGCLDPSSVNCGSAAQVGKTCTSGTSIDVSKYFINNNLWGQADGTGSQCSWRTCQSGDLVGWGTSWTWANNPGKVKSYASLVVGWHWGLVHADTGLPVQLSASKAVTCGWDFKVVDNGTFNVSYDMFAHTIAAPTSTNDPSDEIMVWLYRYGGASPIGATVATATVAGTTWELHKGATDRWNVYSYVRTSNATTSVLNMMDFMKDLVTRGYMQNTKYLTSVQAGAEAFVGTSQLDTNGFYCRVQ